MSGQLKEVRERIRSVNNTQQITKAMKMVSAAKLKKAQDSIVQMRPYALKLDQMLKNILTNMEGDLDISLSKPREIHKVLVVVITSNKGLCGAFNSNVIKAALGVIDEKYSDLANTQNMTLLCIGKKGHHYFRKNMPKCHFIEEHIELFNDLSFDNSAPISNAIIQAYNELQYDAIEVSYGKFKNAGVQTASVEQFLPVADFASSTNNKNSLRSDYIFEPSKEELLNQLIPTILNAKLFRYMLDTHASEHGARMTAMDKATENAQEMLQDLKISYNKARQEAITKELAEIVGGAAALQG